jgi:hypothetical protein
VLSVYFVPINIQEPGKLKNQGALTEDLEIFIYLKNVFYEWIYFVV